MRYLAILIIAVAACRQRIGTPRPLVTTEEHCWWTAMRTTLAVDSVAARFEHAFTEVGLTGSSSTREGDTIWVHAGPTVLPQGSTSLVREARAVAYRTGGDSTRFRYYNGLGALPSEAMNAGALRIAFCGQIGKAVHIQAWTLQSPTAEDSLAVWTRRP